MIVRSLDRSGMTEAYEMLLQPLLTSSDTEDLPFGSVFGIVTPAAVSKRHAHHDREMFVILRGQGVMEIDGERREVGGGDVVLIPPFTHHSLTNTATTQLEMISLFWEHERSLELRPAPGGREDRRPVRVMVPPPTPNGGLHLGHLAGPYVRADACRRAARLRGREAHILSGTDDYQSYVAVRAREAGEDPAELARRSGEAIAGTLRALDIEIDRWVRPSTDGRYAAYTQEAFRRLCASGHVRREEVASAWCPACERSLFQAHLEGGCPACGERSRGGVCEACGLPNAGVDLADPRCAVCGTAAEGRTEPALVLSLAAYADRLRQWHRQVARGEHVAALAERLLPALPDYRLTYPSDWGVPVPLEGLEGRANVERLEGHAIDVWTEYMLGQHLALEGDREGDGGRSIVHFFGYDNSFYYAVLHPILSFALEDDRCRPEALVTNEFLDLDGRKFSTSAGHAIWADDALREANGDALRLAMLRASPETERGSLTAADMRQLATGALTAPIDEWLRGYRALADAVGWRAPAAGAWTDGQRRFCERLNEAADRFAATLLAPEAPSPRAYAATLSELVEHARRFRGTSEWLADVAALKEELATARALDLAAARTFSIIAAPAMPRATARLRAELGLGEPTPDESPVAFLPTGTRLGFGEGTYFPRPSG